MRRELLETLADGRFHSGPALAEQMGLTRGAVWKQVRELTARGLDIQRVPGRGYRLVDPLELLESAAIRAALPEHWRRVLETEVLLETDSTNRRAGEVPEAGLPAACLAESQTAGRGRRGRGWQSPPGGNLYLSLAWRFAALPPDFPALGLAAGVACVSALEEAGITGAALKWPNDLVAGDRKLGGLLLELSGEPPGPCRVVVGLGLNLRMSRTTGIDQPWTDLAALGPLPGRNRLAGGLLGALCDMLAEFTRTGFRRFRADWARLDALAGRPVRVHADREQVDGRAEGVAGDGALRVSTPAGERRFYSGEVSVRLVA